MLTRDRPELAAKAIECFEAQTYARKRLVIFDTSTGQIARYRGHFQHCEIGEGQQTIGQLRNKANTLAGDAEIIVHWDDDDWSHPNRIAEQVSLLQSSGADVVGYNEMLFWRTTGHLIEEDFLTDDKRVTETGEAWRYKYGPPKPTLGTSLCYWRKTWERKPFNAKLPTNPQSSGEDWEFIQERKVYACSSLKICHPSLAEWDGRPRMIARIHGSNFTKYNIEESNGDTWKRVPEWDQRVRELLG
jgi:glycosyltransferase involved in cell wall biosynthesis